MRLLAKLNLDSLPKALGGSKKMMALQTRLNHHIEIRNKWCGVISHRLSSAPKIPQGYPCELLSAKSLLIAANQLLPSLSQVIKDVEDLEAEFSILLKKSVTTEEDLMSLQAGLNTLKAETYRLKEELLLTIKGHLDQIAADFSFNVAPKGAISIHPAISAETFQAFEALIEAHGDRTLRASLAFYPWHTLQVIKTERIWNGQQFIAVPSEIMPYLTKDKDQLSWLPTFVLKRFLPGTYIRHTWFDTPERQYLLASIKLTLFKNLSDDTLYQNDILLRLLSTRIDKELNDINTQLRACKPNQTELREFLQTWRKTVFAAKRQLRLRELNNLQGTLSKALLDTRYQSERQRLELCENARTKLAEIEKPDRGTKGFEGEEAIAARRYTRAIDTMLSGIETNTDIMPDKSIYQHRLSQLKKGELMTHGKDQAPLQTERGRAARVRYAESLSFFITNEYHGGDKAAVMKTFSVDMETIHQNYCEMAFSEKVCDPVVKEIASHQASVLIAWYGAIGDTARVIHIQQTKALREAGKIAELKAACALFLPKPLLASAPIVIVDQKTSETTAYLAINTDIDAILPLDPTSSTKPATSVPLSHSNSLSAKKRFSAFKDKLRHSHFLSFHSEEKLKTALDNEPADPSPPPPLLGASASI